MSLAEVAARLRKEAEEAERQRAAHVGTDVAEQYLGYKLGYEQAVSLLEADPEFQAGPEAIGILRRFLSVTEVTSFEEGMKIGLEVRRRAEALFASLPKEEP